MRSDSQRTAVHHRPRTARSAGALGALVALILGVVATAGPSVAGPTTPTGLTVTVSTDTTDTGGVLPLVLAEVDNGSSTDELDELKVSLVLEPPGASFNTDTPVTFEPEAGTGTGTFSPSTAVFPKGQPTADFYVTYSKVENDIRLKARAGKGNKEISGPPSNAFDIQYSVLKHPAQLGAFTLGDQDCTAATNDSLCAVVLLSNGLTSATGAALAVGACDTESRCIDPESGRVVSFMADLTGAYGTGADGEPDPLTVIMRCDKTYCKGGGVSSYEILATADWGDLDFSTVPACEVKGQVQAETKYCVDYVQSRRDNAGDLLLYWLIAFDPRGAI